MKRFLRVAAGVIAISLLMPLAACSSSSAGSITCAEYNKLDYSKQSDVLGKMLREHDLSQLSTENIAGITMNVTSYCGSSKHSNDPINNAVDWNSNKW
ncbi:hypothetical protein [Actinomyces israelii]|uniref:hypothetical protein n=1 Tax=Actinomyces israelii TaxID=1659 RepID=UPI0005BDF7B0|nr:hypothetical protein [Actinomyces israelii]